MPHRQLLLLPPLLPRSMLPVWKHPQNHPLLHLLLTAAQHLSPPSLLLPQCLLPPLLLQQSLLCRLGCARLRRLLW